MNYRTELYNTLTERLESMGIYEWVDLNKSQLDTPSEHYPMGFPISLISINRATPTDMTHEYKENRVVIDILLAFDRYGDTFEGAIDKDESLKILDTIQETVAVIHWIEGETFNEISQISEVDLTQRYKRPAYKISFETIVRDQIPLIP